MDRKQELGSLKCELRSKLDNMINEGVSDEDLGLFHLLERCMAVFNRTVEFSSDKYIEVRMPELLEEMLDRMDNECEWALTDFQHYAGEHDLKPNDDYFYDGMKRAMEIVSETVTKAVQKNE